MVAGDVNALANAKDADFTPVWCKNEKAATLVEQHRVDECGPVDAWVLMRGENGIPNIMFNQGDKIWDAELMEFVCGESTYNCHANRYRRVLRVRENTCKRGYKCSRHDRLKCPSPVNQGLRIATPPRPPC